MAASTARLRASGALTGPRRDTQPGSAEKPASAVNGTVRSSIPVTGGDKIPPWPVDCPEPRRALASSAESVAVGAKPGDGDAGTAGQGGIGHRGGPGPSSSSSISRVAAQPPTEPRAGLTPAGPGSSSSLGACRSSGPGTSSHGPGSGRSAAPGRSGPGGPGPPVGPGPPGGPGAADGPGPPGGPGPGGCESAAWSASCDVAPPPPARPWREAEPSPVRTTWPRPGAELSGQDPLLPGLD